MVKKTLTKEVCFTLGFGLLVIFALGIFDEPYETDTLEIYEYYGALADKNALIDFSGDSYGYSSPSSKSYCDSGDILKDNMDNAFIELNRKNKNYGFAKASYLGKKDIGEKVDSFERLYDSFEHARDSYNEIVYIYYENQSYFENCYDFTNNSMDSEYFDKEGMFVKDEFEKLVPKAEEIGVYYTYSTRETFYVGDQEVSYWADH